MPVANNTMIVTKNSDANIGVGQTEEPKDCHIKQEAELTLPIGGDKNSVRKKVAKKWTRGNNVLIGTLAKFKFKTTIQKSRAVTTLGEMHWIAPTSNITVGLRPRSRRLEPTRERLRDFQTSQT